MEDWSVISTVVITMRHIVCSVVKIQDSSGKWVIYEENVDNMRVSIYFSVDDMDKALNVDLDYMLEDQDFLEEARQLRRNLEETFIKMWENVRIKLDK